jgi:hypothetical protein
MATDIEPGPAPEVGVSVIQLADALALQGTPAMLARVICWLDEPPAVSEKLRPVGETVSEGAEEAKADTSRIRLWPESDIKRFPETSKPTPTGPYNEANVAGPPSPRPEVPPPAAVVMIPLVDTFRMRLLEASAKKRFPEASTAMVVGSHNDAAVAGPPSPEKPWVPLPATVVIIPPTDTFRIRLLLESAMKRFPEASRATLSG